MRFIRLTRHLLQTITGLFLTCAAIPAAACVPQYTVQPGDTLLDIAGETLGTVFAINVLYDANRAAIGTDPNFILAGMELTIPCGDANGLDWSVMPGPDAIAQIKSSQAIQIIDIRSAKRTDKGVIPRSIAMPFAQWRGPKDNPGAPPSESDLQALINGAGLDLDAPIVIIHHKADQMDVGRAALVYWLLKSSGADTLAIMRGGFKAWEDAALPISDTFATPVPRDGHITFADTWRADEMDIYGIATNQTDSYLLDARPHKMFARLNDAGEALQSTLPGAQSAPVNPLLQALRGEVDIAQGAERVVAHLEANDVDWTTRTVVSFCHTGELAALNWFYASELAGLENQVLYPESLKGWTARGGNLVAGAI